MSKYLIVSVLLFFTGLVIARPADKLAKNDFNNLLKKTRLPLIQKRSEPGLLIDRPSRLRMRSPPEPLVNIQAGKTLILECEVGGNPPPQIHWLKNSERIIQNNDQLEETLDQNSKLGLGIVRGRLVIECVDADDTATYTCVAENAYKRIIAQSQVKVLPIEKLSETAHLTINEQQACIEKNTFQRPSTARITMWTESRLEFIGLNAQLLCRTSGDNVQIDWYSPDGNKIDFINSKYTLLNNGDLFIKKLMWEDMGEYICIARNNLSQDKITSFIYPVLPDKKEEK